MQKDIFLSHAWGKNELGIDNHEKCKQLCNKLINNGYSVWFDDYEMIGNIDKNIMKGINSCKVVLICLTEKYVNKINDAVILNKPNDNCYKEWNYALFKNKIIIPIIMEEKMKKIFLHNDGIIQMYLNALMFIDFSINIEDDYECLLRTLKNYGIYNKNEKKFYKIKSEKSLDKLSIFFGKMIPENSPNRKHKTTIIKKEKNKYLINKIFEIKFNFKFYKKKHKAFIKI